MSLSVAKLFLFFCLLSLNVSANENGAKLFQACIECHGANGQGIESQEAPRIAGQHEWYIYSSLKSFKSKNRSNPKMFPFIEKLSDQDFKDLAAHISIMKEL